MTHSPILFAGMAALAITGHCGSTKLDPGPNGSVPGPHWEDITPAGMDLSEGAFGGSNFGMLMIQVDPAVPTTLYLSTSYQGIWKSTDRGDTWTKLDTGTGGAKLDAGRVWIFTVDPSDPLIMYAGIGYGPEFGLFKSLDGGVSWTQLFTADPGQNPTQPINYHGGALPDLAWLELDPHDHRHLLAAFHDVAWRGYDDAGIVESRDGGATWTLHPPLAGMGVAQGVYVLEDSDTWLLVSSSPGTGTWRTTDAGQHWTRIGAQFGPGQLYRAGGGVYYLASATGILRSADGGASFTQVLAADAMSAVVGDGRRLFAMRALPLVTPGDPFNPMFVAEENAGTAWFTYGDQLLLNGARSLAADRTNHVFYAAAWRAGVFRLVSP